VDAVKARNREAMLLLRKQSRPVSAVWRYAVDDGAICWVDVYGCARTTFVTGDGKLSRTFDGFVV
jgi:hypothetical protein